MILEKVNIEDFKSIKKLNISLHELTCIVGKNESGKSAILEAISFLNFSKYKLSLSHTNKNSNRYDENKFPLIVGYFLLGEEDKNDINDLLPIQFNDKKVAIPKQEINPKWIRITVNGDKKESLILDLILGNNKPYDLNLKYTESEIASIKTQLLELLPLIELFTNDALTLTPITLQQITEKQGSFESFQRLFAIGGLRNTELLNASNIEKLDDRLHVISEKITDLLRKNYTQDKLIRVEVKFTGNQFLLKFIDASKRSYSITERSLGFQYFFAFLINKTFSNRISEQNNLFLLDEPGISLHPEGARDLIKIFENMAHNDQVVYTSHNPFLAYRKKPDNLILARKDVNKGTELITKIYQNKYQVLRKELGLLLNDSFLMNDINIVVEGNADKYIIHYLIHEEVDFEDLTWVHIFSADSASEIIPSVRYLDSLGLKGVCLLDSDKAGLNEIKKPKFHSHISNKKNWSHITLNEILKDSEERTIEDMVNPSKFVEAFNEYYQEQKETIEWKKEFEPLVVSNYKMPILELINKHYNEFADGGINKIAIFRKFTQLNPYERNMEYYKNLKEIILIIKERVNKLG